MLDEKKIFGIFDPVEAWLFVGCAGMFILRLVWGLIPALPDHSLWTLGWMAVVVVWMIDNAKRFGDLKERSGFPVCGFSLGLGAVAAVLSCVFMWTDSSRTPVSMLPIYIGAVVLGLALTAVFVVAMKKFGHAEQLTPVVLAIVAVFSIVAFGTGATRSLNDVLPAAKVVETPSTIVTKNNKFEDGLWSYTATVEADGETRVFNITGDEYGEFEKGDAVTVVDTNTLLGLKFEHIIHEKTAE